MEHSEEFRQRFLELIEDFDCKKTKIASQLKIDYNIFAKITEFGILPKAVSLMRIADYFNISVEYLLGRTNDNYFEKAEFPKMFIERYEELRNEKGLTNYKVAQKLHVSTGYITNWKKKRYLPSLTNLILLSEIFQVSLDYLLGRTDYKKQSV